MLERRRTMSKKQVTQARRSKFMQAQTVANEQIIEED